MTRLKALLAVVALLLSHLPAQAQFRSASVPVAAPVSAPVVPGAEWLTAALQENGAAAYMGQHTWGKGIGQSLVPMLYAGLRGIVYMTSMRWFTPLMNWAQEGHTPGSGGIKPSIVLEADEAQEMAAYMNIVFGRGGREWAPEADAWIVRAADSRQGRP